VRADDGFHVIRLHARPGQRVAWALPR
jgi:hypothetical protein